MMREYKLPCRTKVRYPDAVAAKHALHTLQNYSTREHQPVRVYECGWCGGGWHMTSQPAPGEHDYEPSPVSA